MTRDELIQALYDAGVIPPGYGGTANQFDAFHRFADIVAASERERCAKMCEGEKMGGSTGMVHVDEAINETALACATAIRARREKNE